jgi:hypothetical protein
MLHFIKNVIRAVQARQEALKLNGTHHFLIYANGVNSLTESMKNMRKENKAFINQL